VRKGAATSAGFEVHRHIFVSGPRANGMFIQARQETTSTFHHSHEGGSLPHAHPDTGPASFTIDKDEWCRKTGLRGGGRKTYTVAPTGEQFPIEELEDWQKTFVVEVGNPTPRAWGTGPGVALPLRMVLQFGMTCTVKDGRTPRKRRA
jgi:hypothetical protein